MQRALRACEWQSSVVDRNGLERTIRRAADPIVLMQRVADEALKIVRGAEGTLVTFVHEPGYLTIECASGAMREQIGRRIPMEGSLTGLALKTGKSLCCDDADGDPRVELNLCHSFRVVSSVCVPLWRGDKAVGVFIVTSSRPLAFNDGDVATLTSLAEFISVVIAIAVDLAGVTDALLERAHRDAPGAATAESDDWVAEERFVANVLDPGEVLRLERSSRVDRFLNGRGLAHLFQPVFDLHSGECFAVEALARFSGRPKRTLDVWFAEAHAMGAGVALEVASVRKALNCLRRLPAHISLCVNAGPLAMVSEELGRLLVGSDLSRIVMELTEEAKIDDYPQLSAALAALGTVGMRLAIDDTGAGFASLAHILKLAPELIKLDRELTSGIDKDPVRIAFATALVSFSSELGAEIIAEGIETPTELEVLRRLGIRYGQGYLLSRPTTLEAIPLRLPDAFLAGTASRAS